MRLIYHTSPHYIRAVFEAKSVNPRTYSPHPPPPPFLKEDRKELPAANEGKRGSECQICEEGRKFRTWVKDSEIDEGSVTHR